jgi:hypothetical protein
MAILQDVDDQPNFEDQLKIPLDTIDVAVFNELDSPRRFALCMIHFTPSLANLYSIPFVISIRLYRSHEAGN